MVFDRLTPRERGIVSAFRTCLIRAALFGLMAVLPGGAATADISHKVRFQADAQIILWGQNAQHTEENLYDRLPASQPLRFAGAAHWNPVIVTGQILSVDQGSNARHYPLRQDGLSAASFHIASNAPYGIRAEITGAPPPAHDIKDSPFQFGISRVGKSAYAPQGMPLTQPIVSLNDLRRPAIVFQSSRRTAARPGTLAEQSVQFAAHWGSTRQGDTIDITFTVFVP